MSIEIFDPDPFRHSNLPGPLTNRLKYFRFWLRFRNYLNFWNLPGVWYPSESISLGYRTPASQCLGVSYPVESMSRGIIPKRVNVLGYCTPASRCLGVSYPSESMSRGIIPKRVNVLGYPTPASQCLGVSYPSESMSRGIIPKRVMRLFWILFKGQSNEIFYRFFHTSSLPDPGPLSNGLKYFRFWLRFRRIIRVFS